MVQLLKSNDYVKVDIQGRPPYNILRMTHRLNNHLIYLIFCSNLMNKDLAYLVSNIDLQRKFKSTPSQMKIMLYPELNDKEDIMDILPSKICVCFILLKTSEQSCHWTSQCNNSIY